MGPWGTYGEPHWKLEQVPTLPRRLCTVPTPDRSTAKLPLMWLAGPYLREELGLAAWPMGLTTGREADPACCCPQQEGGWWPRLPKKATQSGLFVTG